jgi:integrase
MYHRHGAYYLVRHGKWLRLAADLPGALREYARRLGGNAGSFPDFIDKMESRIMRDKNTGRLKAESTRKQYAHCCRLLREMLRELSPEELTARDVKHLRAELQETPALANRAITVLSLLMAEAVEDEIVAANPCAGVDRIRVAARTRRITPVEYASIHANATPLLRAAMDLAYLTGQRIGDVLSIRTDALIDDGVFFEQQKTGTRLVVAWTPELRAAVKAAQALKPNVLRPTYIWGFTAPSYFHLHKLWQSACKRARVTDAHIHDIRAMAGTDADAQGIDAKALLGHTDARTTRIYLRDKVVPVVSGPRLKRA